MPSFSERASSAKRSANKFFKRLLIVIVIVFIGVMFFLYYGTYSTGVRAGVVLKISERGMIFKTHEGQLDILSFGAVKSDNQLSQTFEFSVEKSRNDLIDKIEDVALSGERVRLRYEEKYAVLPWRGETKYFVTDVERMASGNRNKPQDKKDDFPN
ncbi:MAG TPA: hypothetical protein VJ911_04000 [Cryomorphaceae bacterium]|nr:hypothetical protein [Cryomorphaceae bacterium]